MEMWFSEFHTPDVKHSIRVNRQLYSKQSDYQRIDIFETPEFGRVLTLDGNVMLTERDEFIYDEMITHVPMSVHKEAKDILVIGAGDGGVVRELTRYDRVRHIDLVEMDPMVVEACRAYLPGNACRLDDRRVHLHYENALKFIRRCEGKYDLIIVDSSDPFGPSEGLFTREFYGNCYNALKDGGLLMFDVFKPAEKIIQKQMYQEASRFRDANRNVYIVTVSHRISQCNHLHTCLYDYRKWPNIKDEGISIKITYKYLYMVEVEQLLTQIGFCNIGVKEIFDGHINLVTAYKLPKNIND